MARRSALAFLWARHRLATVALGLSLAAAALFAVRLLVFTLYWSDPAHRNQPIEGWMTPRYVAASYGVDPDVVRAALPEEAAALAGGRPTLDRIAEAAGIPLDDLIAGLAAALPAAPAQ